MSSLLDIINNPRFPLETAIDRDSVINNCFEYPLQELDNVTKTIPYSLHTMAEYY